MNRRRPSLWQRLFVFYLCGAVFGGELVVMGQHFHAGTSVVWPLLGAVAMLGLSSWQILAVFL